MSSYDIYRLINVLKKLLLEYSPDKDSINDLFMDQYYKSIVKNICRTYDINIDFDNIDVFNIPLMNLYNKYKRSERINLIVLNE